MQAAETKTTTTPDRTRIGISIPCEVLEGVDKIKGYDTRSHFIATALVWYLRQLEKGGKITILQNFSSVSSPESSADGRSDVVNNSPQHRSQAQEDAVPVTS